MNDVTINIDTMYISFYDNNYDLLNQVFVPRIIRMIDNHIPQNYTYFERLDIVKNHYNEVRGTIVKRLVIEFDEKGFNIDVYPIINEVVDEYFLNIEKIN